MLKIRNLSKSYNKGTIPAVNDLNMTVNPGEIFGFIGPNGAGKTTTIKMITGILSPDSGSILINGKDMVKDDISAKKMIGYVPDSPEIYEKLTGIEYLEFIGDVYDVPVNERKKNIAYYLDMFELGTAANDQIKSFSHGMRQKLVLTGALLHNPKLWILDEPLVGLDPRAAHLLKEQMRQHCKQGNTVFFSTHVLEVAEKLCDRIGIINQGKLVASGTLEELKSQASDSSLENIFLEITKKDD